MFINQFAKSLRLIGRHLVMLLSAAGMFWPAQLRPQTPLGEEAGKLIYSKGESPSQSALEAVLGDTTVPATLMPCASCHGADGKGRAEGGVVPADIRWKVLTRAHEAGNALARRRPEYDLTSLRKVLREGIDPAGNELGIIMPRYRITDADLESLTGFLQQLGVKNDPGITATSVRAATVVPSQGPMAESGASAAGLMRAYFAEVNEQGGIYGRRVELEIIATRDNPGGSAAAVDEFVRGHEVFALVGLLVPGAGPQLAASLENSGIPAIDAFAPDADGESLGKAKVFHVLSGTAAQARVLVKFAREQVDGPAFSLAVVYPESQQRLAAIVLEECKARSCSSVTPVSYTRFDSERITSALMATKPDGIVFLGHGAELEALLAAAGRVHWQPRIFQPGLLAGQEAFRLSPEASEHVFFSFPMLPSDVAPEALGEYAYLVNKYKLKPMHTARALATLAAAKVFMEGLRQSGRELSREGFVDKLATLYNFSTGLTPPITYGATRRVGALGAYVVRLDTKTKTFAPAASWMESPR